MTSRILIADDDSTSRMLLSMVVKQLGYEVVLAEDGAQAWELLRQDDAPRFILLDWMMPGLTGPQICQRLRILESGASSYIILLTSLAEQHHLIEGLEAGADDFITKPFSRAVLEARIKVGARTLQIQERLLWQSERLSHALEQVNTLRGLIPICCQCRKIRGDEDYWLSFEDYVSNHTAATLSHSICPDCFVHSEPESSDQ